jgi:hypothetical protein
MIAPLNRRNFLGWIKRASATAVALTATGCSTSVETTINAVTPDPPCRQAIRITIEEHDVLLNVEFVPDAIWRTLGEDDLPRYRKTTAVRGGMYVVSLPED